MTVSSGWKMVWVVFLLCAAATFAQGQGFPVDFEGTNGTQPMYEALVQGRDGNAYGTTYYGGAGSCVSNSGNGCGTVFKVSPLGELTTLHSFNLTDGSYPTAGLVLGNDGNFYGMTNFGGDLTCNPNFGCGTVFKITPSGTLTTLHSFTGADGSHPWGPLVQGSDGAFYGMATSTIFKITRDGTFTILNTCCGAGGQPYDGLVQANDGFFYGTTYYGGKYNQGTIFRMSPAGRVATLYSFGGSDGREPYGGVIQATDGNLYGTTERGGTYDNGTVFRFDADLTLTTLHNFNDTDGVFPQGSLVQATDGSFYGTTDGSGPNGAGTVFRIESDGTFGTEFSFDGYPPIEVAGTLLQATNGVFYGTTLNGGDRSCSPPSGCGMVFSLPQNGLGPFVSLVENQGKVGSTGGILGQGFKGTTSVEINGVPANFTVVSSTYLTATVPQGATTGYVTVTTPSGVLKSNVPFRVIQ